MISILDVYHALDIDVLYTMYVLSLRLTSVTRPYLRRDRKCEHFNTSGWVRALFYRR